MKLKGYLQSGIIFIGDPLFMTQDQAQNPTGVIEPDPLNPFKNWDEFLSKHVEDSNMDFPGSVNGDLPGRGIVVQTHKQSGQYTIERETDPATGELIIKIRIRD